MAFKLYKDLYSKNAEYDPELNKKLQLLYQGGFAIRKNAELFLERLAGLESAQAYKSRLKAISYIPYLSEFITQFSASLFSESLEVKAQGDAPDNSTQGNDMTDDFYKQFLERCDLEGRSFHQFMQDTLEKGLSELCVYITMDFPSGERRNRYQEKKDGLDKGYVCTIPYENVIDWKIDPATGRFLWVKEYYECFPDDSPLDEPKHYFEFKMRTLKPGKKGKMYGGWEVWRSAIMTLDKKVDARTKFELITKESITTSFPEINLWKFKINKAYHVGQQIGSICEEHYQRRSFMVSNANKTCVSLGVVTLGPEIGAAGDMVPLDLEIPTTPRELRSKLESDGWTVLRQTADWADKVEIVESKGESHKFISEELKHLVESMMQTLRQMNMTASANQKAVGRSADSKQMDQHGTSMLLSVYERIIKDFSKLLFGALSQGRSEEINFAVEGLSIAEPTFERSQVITEITSLGIDVLKFPDMWKGKYLNRVATQLIDNNLTDKERLELSDKFNKLIENGTFEAMDPAEADAAGNKMAKTTAAKGASASNDPADPTNAQLPTNAANIDPKTMNDRSVSTAGVATSVMAQLEPDYKKSLLSWIPAAHWVQMDVPMDQIDDTNRASWEASKDQGKVDSMAQAMNEGWNKPIVLVNEPNANKLVLVDGHHRFLAAEANGETTISAFVAYVGGVDGQWKEMHDLQRQGEAGGKSNQKSEQKSQQK